MDHANRARVSVVNNETPERATRFERIQEWWEGEGLAQYRSQRRFTELTGIAQETFRKALTGDDSLSDSKLAQLEGFIGGGYAERDEPAEAHEGDEITFTVTAAAVGLDVTVKGPLVAREELEESVLRIIRRASETG